MDFNEKLYSILECTKNIDNNPIVMEDCSLSSRQLDGYHIVVRRSKLEELKSFLLDAFGHSDDQIVEGAFSDKSTDDDIIQCFRICFYGSITDKFITRYGGVSELIYYADSNDVTRESSLNETPLDKIVEPVSVETSNDLELDVLKDQIESIGESDEVKSLKEQLDLMKERLNSKDEALSKQDSEILNMQIKINGLEESLQEALNSTASKETEKELEEYKRRYPKGEVTDEVVDLFLNLLENLDAEKTVNAIKLLLSKKASENDEKDIGKLITDIMEQYISMEVISLGNKI